MKTRQEIPSAQEWRTEIDQRDTTEKKETHREADPEKNKEMPNDKAIDTGSAETEKERSVLLPMFLGHRVLSQIHLGHRKDNGIAGKKQKIQKI